MMRVRAATSGAMGRFGVFALVATSLGLLTTCRGGGLRPDGLDPSSLPTELRDDYAVFAHRCSKCHSLARPLNSGISDENYWALYVGRMRRQPGSGITEDDAAPILRFLHYYSLEQQRKHDKPIAPPPASSTTVSRLFTERAYW